MSGPKKPSMRLDAQVCKQANGDLIREYIQCVNLLIKEFSLTKESSQIISMLQSLQDRILPNINFSQYETIPRFDQLVNVLTSMLYLQPKIEYISIANILRLLFKHIMVDQPKYIQYVQYFLIKLVQLNVIGLKSNSLECCAAFMGLFFEIVQAGEGNIVLKNVISGQLYGIIYSLLNTQYEINDYTTIKQQLLPIQNQKVYQQYQSLEFIQQIFNNIDCLKLIELFYTKKDVLINMIELFGIQQLPSIYFSTHYAKYYGYLINNYKHQLQTEDEFKVMLEGCYKVITHIINIFKVYQNIQEQTYYKLIDVVFISVEALVHLQQFVQDNENILNIQLIFNCIISSLKHQRKFEYKQLDSLIQIIKQPLINYIQSVDIMNSLIEILKETNQCQHLLTSEFLMEYLLPQLNMKIFKKIGQHKMLLDNQGKMSLRQSQVLQENSDEYKRIMEEYDLLIKTIPFLKTTDYWTDFFVELLEEYYPIQYLQEEDLEVLDVEQSQMDNNQQKFKYNECRLIYHIFKALFENFSVDFFTEKFYILALQPLDRAYGDSYVSAKIFLLAALRDYLCIPVKSNKNRNKNIGFFSYLFKLDDQKEGSPIGNYINEQIDMDIFTLLESLAQNIDFSPGNINMLTLTLGILQVLLENARYVTGFDYFELNKKRINKFLNQVIVKTLIKLIVCNQDSLNKLNQYFSHLGIQALSQPTDFTIQNQLTLSTLAHQKDILVQVQEFTQFSICNATQTYQSQFLSLEHECFALLSFMIQLFGIEQLSQFEQKHNQLSQIIYITSMVIQNVQTFNHCLYQASIVIFSQLSVNQYILDKYFKSYFYKFENIKHNINALQILCNSLPMISACHRVLCNNYTSLSKLSITPIIPLVAEARVKFSQSINNCLHDFMLLISEKQVEGRSLVSQQYERFINLQYNKEQTNQQIGKQEIKVQNIMINPIYDDLADLLSILPLELFSTQSFSQQKLLTTLNNQIVEQIFDIEPEIVVNSITEYINYNIGKQRKEQITDQTINVNKTMSQVQENHITAAINSNDDVIKQNIFTKLLKLPLQQFSYQNYQAAAAVLEYNYQKMKQYFTSSAYTNTTVAVQQSLLDLTQFALQSQNTFVYYDILAIVSEFSEKQLQHSLTNFIKLSVQRLRLFKHVAKYQIEEQMYNFYVNTLKCLIDYDQVFVFNQEKKQQGLGITQTQRSLLSMNGIQQQTSMEDSETYLSSYISIDVLTEYQTIAVEFFIQNNVNRIAEILSLLIGNCRKQNEILLKLFLITLNNYFKKLLPVSVVNDKYEYLQLLKYLNNVESIEQYFVFLSQVFYIECTYTGEFQYLFKIFNAELYSQGVDLLFNIGDIIQGGELTKNLLHTRNLTQFINIQQNCNHFNTQLAYMFFQKFQSQIMLDQLFYQKNLVNIINYWNREHVISEDITQIFNIALERSNLILIYILVRYRIREMDLSYKDKILDLFSRIDINMIKNSINNDNHAIVNIIYVQFLNELCLQLSRVHNILIRAHSELISQLIVNVIVLIQRNHKCLQYLSGKNGCFTDVIGNQIECYGDMLNMANQFNFKIGNTIDTIQTKYIYDFRASMLIRHYIKMLSVLTQKQSDGQMIKQLTLKLLQLCMETIQEQSLSVSNRKDTNQIILQQQPSSMSVQAQKQHVQATICSILDLCCELMIGLTYGSNQLTTQDLQYLEDQMQINFIQFMYEQFDMILKDNQNHLQYHILRRFLLIFSFVGQTEENTDINKIFGKFLEQNVFSYNELEKSIQDSKKAYLNYQKQKRLIGYILLPIIGRLLILQENQPMAQIPVLPLIFKYIQEQNGYIASQEYSMNITAAYYQAKLQATEINNCRTVNLPGVLLLIGIQRLQQPLELQDSSTFFIRLFETWSIDSSLRQEGWYQKLRNLYDDSQENQTAIKWYSNIIKVFYEVLE